MDYPNIYRERAYLVAALASMYPSGWTNDPNEPDFPVIMIQTPRGQMSWHIASEDLDLFSKIPLIENPPVWDGHSTEEKYERLQRLTNDPWSRGSDG